MSGYNSKPFGSNLALDIKTIISDVKPSKFSLVIDTETTGVNPALDRVCEIAIILTDWKEVHAIFSTYVNPGFAFDNIVNGLSLRECGTAPTFRDLCDSGLLWILSCPDEFVAHQLDFDKRFLSVELRHLGLLWPNRPTYDTFRRTHLKLVDACAKYKVDTSDVQWHSALGDCVATFRLAQKLRELDISEVEDEAPIGLQVRF